MVPCLAYALASSGVMLLRFLGRASTFVVFCCGQGIEILRHKEGAPVMNRGPFLRLSTSHRFGLLNYGICQEWRFS